MKDQAGWEYRTVTVDPREAMDTINHFGSQGWEAFAVSVQFTSHYVWMKRPLDWRR